MLSMKAKYGLKAMLRLARDYGRDRSVIRELELPARQPDHRGFVREAAHHRAAQLSAGADNQHLRRHAALNRRIWSSSNSPSQRATTTVAMQLPITFTAVRPMSMI